MHFDCEIAPGKAGRGFVYLRGKKKRLANSYADLLFLFDKDLTVELQRQRSDLFFIHAGVVASRREAIALVAPSGVGKSTTVLALLQAGFKYVSDELLPIDLSTGRVYSYPRALCLKAPPAPPSSLPARTIDAGGLLYVPVPARTTIKTSALRLRTLFLLGRISNNQEPRLRRLDVAEASARLYANALNALAHSGSGLDAVIRVAAGTECYELTLGDSPRNVDVIQSLIRRR